MNATELFGATMVVGYYSQDVLFVEPMISRDKLLERTSFAMTVPIVENTGDDITFPNSFEAVYDAENNSYRFVFTM